jgi:2-methylisocitrate lyase-like PEP mutase family enzyme
VLLNAWDAGSARVLVDAGASAIATTPEGMAWSLGYAEPRQIPSGEFIAACARICRVVSVPISVDIGAGDGRRIDEICDLVRSLLGLGVVGIEMEDGVEDGQVVPAEVLCARVAAVRTMATEANARLFINARIDTYVAPQGDRRARYEDTARRARAYAAAGADGIAVPELDLIDVARLVRSVSLPLTVDVADGWGPPSAGLALAGVRRVSLGSGPMQSAFNLLHRVATSAVALR